MNICHPPSPSCDILFGKARTFLQIFYIYLVDFELDLWTIQLCITLHNDKVMAPSIPIPTQGGMFHTCECRGIPTPCCNSIADASQFRELPLESNRQTPQMAPRPTATAQPSASPHPMLALSASVERCKYSWKPSDVQHRADITLVGVTANSPVGNVSQAEPRSVASTTSIANV